jgi:hypothetical protein
MRPTWVLTVASERNSFPALRVPVTAFENAVRLHELAAAHASLEEAFMELTGAAVEFRAAEPHAEQAVLTGSEV